MAALYGHLAVVKCLVTKNPATITCTGEHGALPIHWAARNGRLEVVKYYVEELQADVNCTNQAGHTPFSSGSSQWKIRSSKVLRRGASSRC